MANESLKYILINLQSLFEDNEAYHFSVDAHRKPDAQGSMCMYFQQDYATLSTGVKKTWITIRVDNSLIQEVSTEVSNGSLLFPLCSPLLSLIFHLHTNSNFALHNTVLLKTQLRFTTQEKGTIPYEQLVTVAHCSAHAESAWWQGNAAVCACTIYMSNRNGLTLMNYASTTWRSLPNGKYEKALKKWQLGANAPHDLTHRKSRASCCLTIITRIHASTNAMNQSTKNFFNFIFSAYSNLIYLTEVEKSLWSVGTFINFYTIDSQLF